MQWVAHYKKKKSKKESCTIRIEEKAKIQKIKVPPPFFWLLDPTGKEDYEVAIKVYTHLSGTNSSRTSTSPTWSVSHKKHRETLYVTKGKKEREGGGKKKPRTLQNVTLLAHGNPLCMTVKWLWSQYLGLKNF